MAPILRQLGSRILGQTTLLAGRALSRTFVADDIDRYQFSVLATLEAFGDQSQAALGRRTNLDRSDVTATVTDLEAALFVSRTQDVVDRRQKRVALTPAGYAHFKGLKVRALEAQQVVFGSLGKKEQQTLYRLLLKVHDHLAIQDRQVHN